MLRKIIALALCFLFAFSACAADFEITEDFQVNINKEALLAALFEADIASMREAIDLKLISCYELTAYYLERIEAYNDTFQCFITLCDNALDIAKQRDEAIANGTASGALFGIPIVVKDNIDYEGFPTTNGEGKVYTTAKHNATVVQRLLDEGAVILGKTNMSAGAEDAICSINDDGLQTFNAYHPSLASGGSSGGSAVAVSLNFAAAGLGTDTNSSLRYPSALNGCVSLRTTHGLIDRSGCVPLNPSRDTVGAITRSVIDQALMLDVLTEGEYAFTDNLNTNALDGMRIGVLLELSYPVETMQSRNHSVVDSEIQAIFDRAVYELKSCGAEIVNIAVPSIFSDIKDSSTLYHKLEKILAEHNVSALIYPAYLHTPHYATKEALNGTSIYSLPYISNCNTISSRSGAPEITVPIGHHSIGAGVGLEIISLRNHDQLLLDIAHSYMSRFDYRVAPKIAPSLHFGEKNVSLREFLLLYRQMLARANKLQIASEETQNTGSTSEITNKPISNAPDTTSPAAPLASRDSDAPVIRWYYILPPIALILTASAYVLFKKYRRKTPANK